MSLQDFLDEVPDFWELPDGEYENYPALAMMTLDRLTQILFYKAEKTPNSDRDISIYNEALGAINDAREALCYHYAQSIRESADLAQKSQDEIVQRANEAAKSKIDFILGSIDTLLKEGLDIDEQRKVKGLIGHFYSIWTAIQDNGQMCDNCIIKALGLIPQSKTTHELEAKIKKADLHPKCRAAALEAIRKYEDVQLRLYGSNATTNTEQEEVTQ